MSLKNIIYLIVALAGIYFGFKLIGIVGKILFWVAIAGVGYVGYNVIANTGDKKKIDK